MKRLLLFLILALPAVAQVQIFIMPTAVVQQGTKTRVVAAYASMVTEQPKMMMPFGAEPVCLFAAPNATAAEIANISVQSGVTALPFNLGLVLTTNDATKATAFLESVNIPGDWVVAGMTWNNVLRYTMMEMQLMQRYHGVAIANGHTPYVFNGTSNTLNTLISAIPSTMLSDLETAATSLGYSLAGITGSMTVRQGLEKLAQQWQSTTPIYFGGLTF